MTDGVDRLMWCRTYQTVAQACMNYMAEGFKEPKEADTLRAFGKGISNTGVGWRGPAYSYCAITYLRLNAIRS